MKNSKSQKGKILYVPPKLQGMTNQKNYCVDGSGAKNIPECKNGPNYNVPLCNVGFGANSCEQGEAAEACLANGHTVGDICAVGTGPEF